VFEDEQLSYRELNDRANRLAHSLRKLNVGPEVPVGVCLERSLEVVVSLLAILKRRRLPAIGPGLPETTHWLHVGRFQGPVLLTQNRLVQGLPEHRSRVVCLDSDAEAIARESARNPRAQSSPITSLHNLHLGSTGQPKGFLVSHGSIAEHCRDAEKYYELKPTDRVLQFASMSFDLSLEQILPTLIVGRVWSWWEGKYGERKNFIASG